MTHLADLDALAARVPDGSSVIVPADHAGVSMALTRALVRRRPRNLHLVCLPTSGLQAELLIGAGCVATLETSAITLGEHGVPHRFLAGLRAGAFRMRDATCPAIYAALQQGQLLVIQLGKLLAGIATELHQGVHHAIGQLAAEAVLHQQQGLQSSQRRRHHAASQALAQGVDQQVLGFWSQPGRHLGQQQRRPDAPIRPAGDHPY